MTTTIETILLLIALGLAIETTIIAEDGSVSTTVSVMSEPGGNIPPPQQ